MLKLKKILKLIAFLSGFLLILYGVNFARHWHSPDLNSETDKTMHSCIYHNMDYISTVLNSMGTKFEVSSVENAGKNCFNPSFPIIHIKTAQEHNAWLHIVRTDSSDKELQEFIDGDIKLNYPFYTVDQDFYDAPLWYYTLFSKPLSYWIGHTYAVKVDYTHKTIKVIGGIKWGFRLSYFPIKPQIILPSGLNSEDWQADFEVFKQELRGYRSIN
ncbi:MAG TPA: hypothetical protein LFW21_06295 [Rickettsia endosymbiont of Pyrocoelia pectoralis]|nr:hypothetical protein [Rickettsia endosymbiont of Pyrocoelia pectoralis]